MLLSLVGVLAAALIWVVYGTLEMRIVTVGDRAPDFEVVTDKGRTVSVKNFGGKLLVLNFWATWCPPCIEEIPSLNAFQTEMASKGVVVLGVSVDTNQEVYQRFLKTRGLAFQTSRDPEAAISYSYGTVQYPETYIIDRSGRVIEKIISNQNWMDPEFLTHINNLL